MADALLQRKYPKIWEPFAGNFSFTQVAMACSSGVPVVSGEVNVYSVSIGLALNGKALDFQVSDKLQESFKFDESWDGVRRAAYIIMLSDLSRYYSKVEKMEFAKRFVENYRKNMGPILDGISAKLTKVKERIHDWEFRPMDAFKLFDEVGPGEMVMYDPPYFTNDYEKMYSFLDSNITWDQPEYTIFTEDKKLDVVRSLIDRDSKVFWRTEEPVELPGLKLVFDYAYKAGKKYLIYSNDTRAPIHCGWVQTLREEQGTYPLLDPEAELTGKEKVLLREIPAKQFNHYRMMWTHKAKMKDAAEICYGFFINEKLAGVTGFMSGMMFSHDLAVIISDALPPFKNHPKLSKLLLMTLLTTEFTTVISRRLLWSHTGYTTIAYTNNPASMKYRGMFELTKRDPGIDGHKFKLTYSTRKMVAKTIKEAFAQWWSKYGKDRGSREAE